MPLKSQGPLQMLRPQLRHFLKGSAAVLAEFLSAVLCYEFMSGSPTLLVSDVRWMTSKKALRLELSRRFRSCCLYVCRKAMTKTKVLSVAHEIRQSKRKEELSIAASKIDVYSQKESNSRQTRSPTLPPCAASQLDFAGWSLGAGSKDVSASPQHRRAQHLGFDDISFRLRGFAVARARREDCYGFTLPQKTDDV